MWAHIKKMKWLDGRNALAFEGVNETESSSGGFNLLCFARPFGKFVLSSVKSCMMFRFFKSRLRNCLFVVFLAWATGVKSRAADMTNAPPLTRLEVTNQAPTLTSAEQIHRLSRQQADAGRHVLIRGVVTCTLPAFDGAVVQDGQAGIYINGLDKASIVPPEVGDLVEVEGTTDSGNFAPQVKSIHVIRVGTAKMPAPVHPYWDQMINGSLDTEYVEIEGILTSVLTNGVTLRTHDGKINVLTNDTGSSEAPSKYNEGALVRMRGCLFASWDGLTHQVNVSEIRMYYPAVTVVEPAPTDVFAEALKDVPDLLRFDPRASALRRVKVSGQIMLEREDEYYAMDGTNGFRFIPKTKTNFDVGELVEVVGFPNLTGPSAVLEDAVAREIGMAPLRDARPVDLKNLFRAQNDAVRVKIDAILLSLSQDRRTLELQAGLQRFVARLDGATAAPDQNASGTRGPRGNDLPVGSRLLLTGVYAGNGGNRPASEQVASFELLLNSLADIQMLARPPFWTLRRTLILVGVLLGVLFLSLVWIRLLHHEVQQRTVQLQNEVHTREQAERQHALAQERARIARDLHDDLGSSLTEIAMLATAGPSLKLPTEQAAQRMESIAGKSRTLVKALDEIVWVVDPSRDTLGSVVRYLASYAEEYLAGMQITCRVQIPNAFDERPVSGQVRHHLFLGVKEALNNVVRHGHASEVSFRVRVQDDCLFILIADNGRGFDPSSSFQGHGLSNLRERLEQLHGRCKLDSTPGGGTTILLEVPLSAPKNNS
jgi:signal transduction histidine kinase